MTIDPHLAPHWDRSALVIIDMQRDFLSEGPHAIPGTSVILPRLRRLCDTFRETGRPIIHVIRLYLPDGSNADRVRRTLISSGVRMAAPGSPGRDIAAGLLPPAAPGLDDDLLLRGQPQRLTPNEYVIFKSRWGAFYRTPLDQLLAHHGADTVVFAGCNLPNCPRASIIEASERDYRIAVATDAVSQSSDQGLREIAGIGAILLTADTIAQALRTGGATQSP